MSQYHRLAGMHARALETVNLLLCPPKNVCVKKNYVKRLFFSDFQENPGVLAILSCYSKSAVVYYYGKFIWVNILYFMTKKFYVKSNLFITFTGLVLLGLIEFPVKEKITYLVDFFPSNCQVRLKLSFYMSN